MEEDKITISYEIVKRFLNPENSILEKFNKVKFKNVQMQTSYGENNDYSYFINYLQPFISHLTNNDLKIENLWCQKYNSGYHGLHTHKGCKLCFTWYLHADENCSNIIFRNPGFPYIETHEIKIKPYTGLMLLFPPFIPHEVEYNYDSKRYIIAGNLN